MSKLKKKSSEDRLDRVERVLAGMIVETDKILQKMAADREREAEERRKAAAEEEARWKKAAAEEESRRMKAAAEEESRRMKAAAEEEAWRMKAAAESAANFRQIEKSLAETNKHLGGFTQGAAESLEEEYADAIEESKRIGDIAIDKAYSNPRAAIEFDAAYANGKVVVVLEVKHKILPRDVRKFAEERLPCFAAEFPGIAGGRKIYGAVGGGRITKEAKKEAEKYGLIVLGLRNRKLVVKSDKCVRAV